MCLTIFTDVQWLIGEWRDGLGTHPAAGESGKKKHGGGAGSEVGLLRIIK